MRSFRMIFDIDAEGVYSAEDIEDAQNITEEEAEIIYSQLRGRYGVSVATVEEV